MTQHDEERPLSRIGKIERGLQHTFGERWIADDRCPQLMLRLEIQQVPSRIAEAEHLHAFGEHLDLVIRAEDDADVAVAGGRQRMRAIDRRARDPRARSRAALAAPAREIDNVEDEAVPVDEKLRLDAVADAK